MRIYKLVSLINCKLPFCSSSNHQNLLFDKTVFTFCKTNYSKRSIYGDIGHYIKSKQKNNMKLKELENLISHTLKRHNGHRLVYLKEGSYAVIFPKKEILRVGGVQSSALRFWYSYWKNKKQLKEKK
jgi:hypothetical protein